jgi:hypothetical protein
MAIQDSNPERRNLVVTALAFIAYFYGGGTFVNHSVTLQVVSVNFTNTRFLAALAWTSFVWFIYRYWLLNSGEFSKGFRTELRLLYNTPQISKHLEAKTKLKFLLNHEPSNDESGYVVNKLEWEGWCACAGYANASKVERDPKTKAIRSYTYTHPTATQSIDYKFTGISDWLLVARICAKLFIREKSFSDHLVPYIVSIIALFGPVYRHLV